MICMVFLFLLLLSEFRCFSPGGCLPRGWLVQHVAVSPSALPACFNSFQLLGVTEQWKDKWNKLMLFRGEESVKSCHGGRQAARRCHISGLLGTLILHEDKSMHLSCQRMGARVPLVSGDSRTMSGTEFMSSWYVGTCCHKTGLYARS